MQERDITLDDVECMWPWGDDFCEAIDYKNYSCKEDLIGYFDAMKALRTWLDAQNGKSLGPSRKWVRFLEEISRYEEIKRRRVKGGNPRLLSFGYHQPADQLGSKD